MSKHLVIPDTQVKEGVPTDHLEWIGQYILDKRPDTVVHLGDHWDMPSLCSYDRGKLQFEGRRYRLDIDAGNAGFARLNKPIDEYNQRRAKSKKEQYRPRRIILRGNHEQRIERAVESSAEFEGLMGYNDLDTRSWEVVDFLEPINIDGVVYSHYFYNPLSGKPYGGQASLILKNVGHTFTQGHRQVLDYAIRFVQGRSQHALIAGAAYMHTEDYLGYQGNSHWRGIIMKHEVHEGSYDPMFVSLNYLCARYEGVQLNDFLYKKYGYTL